MYTVRENFVVRRAGLPVSTLDGMRGGELLAAVYRLLAARDLLRGEGARLSDELYRVIGDAPADVKPRLVGLRRAVFQGRRRPELADADLLAALPAPLAARVRNWVARLDHADRLYRSLPDRFAATEARSLAALRDAVRRPEFQRGLVHSSPVLFGELRKWLAAPATTVPSRQVQLRLAKYVARAAAKTSPYSTFTALGLGRWTGGGPAGHGLGRSDRRTGGPAGDLPTGGAPAARYAVYRRPRITVEPQMLYVQAVSGALAGCPELREWLPVRVNPSLVDGGTELCWLGRLPAEPLLTVPATAAVRAVLAAVAGCGTAPLMGAVLDRLAAGGADRDRAAGYLAKLVELGLLDAAPPVPDQHDDPLGALADWLDGCPGAAALDRRLPGVPAALRAWHTSLAAATRWEPPERTVGRRDDAGLALRELLRRLELPPPGRNPYYENALLAGDAAEFDRDAFGDLLDSFDAVRRLLGLFRLGLPYRLALAADFADRYPAGAEVPFPRYYRAVTSQLRAAGTELARLAPAQLRLSPRGIGAELAASRVTAVRLLHRLRDDARALVETSGRDGVRHVEPAAAHALADTWPAFVDDAASVAGYGQVFGPPDRPRLVLNTLTSGFGHGASRVRRLAGQAGEDRPPAASVTGTADRVYLELDGLVGAALNRRDPGLRYAVDYPFTTSTRPAGDLIRLTELRVRLDAGTGLLTLVSDRTGGAAVRPVHTGHVAHPLLPPAYRFLLEGFGEASWLLSSYGPPPLLDDGWPVTKLRDRPRVEIGDVVVHRAKWVAAGADLPRRERGESEVDHLVRAVGWFRERGIPERSFVRVLDPSADFDLVALIRSKAHKPAYLDLANPYLLAQLDRIPAAPGVEVIFEEALPAPADAAPDGADRRVTEVILELSTFDHGRRS